MANDCNYKMRIKGNKEDAYRAFNIISADYDYNTGNIPVDGHVSRNFKCNIVDIDEIIDSSNEITVLTIDGCCTWSVYSCMLEGDNTYYNSIMDRSPDITTVTTLDRISSKCNVEIEVYSEEFDLEFQEHYMIKDGAIVINETEEYQEYYWDKDEFETIHAFNEAHDTDFAEEDFDEGDYAYIGGFSEWVFSI